MLQTTSWENRLLELAEISSIQTHTKSFSAIVAGEVSLKESYQHAERITAKYSKSFHFASWLLPKEKRSAVRALYAFCRTVDDIVDEVGFANDRELELNYWREMVKTASYKRGDLVAISWADTLTRYHIPHHYALQLIDGVARDLKQTQYRTFDDLTTYCYSVASTVGLMSMHIIGFKNNLSIPYAIKLGVALQMTNILRDIHQDYKNGRMYLPLEELEQFGIREEDIAKGRVTETWRNFMRFQINRTRFLYKEAQAGIIFLEKEGQLAIQAASIFYEGILDVIEKNDYDVFRQRASLSKLNKITRLVYLLLKKKNK